MKNFFKKNNFCFGYGFIEAIIYVAALAMMFTLVVNSMLITISAFSQAKVSSRINVSAGTAMERMVFEIKRAYDLDPTSVFDVSTGKLVLNTTDSLGADTTIKFEVGEEGQLTITEGVGAPQALTLPGVIISNLIFREIQTVSVSKAVKIELEITGSIKDFSRTDKFYNSVILKGSYL